MVIAAIIKIKQGKAGGPSGVIVEMIKIKGKQMVTVITKLLNKIIHGENIPKDWKNSCVIKLL